MANKPKKRATPTATPVQGTGPWMPMRTGIIIIAITSVAMAVLTTVQYWSYNPPQNAIMGGLVWGALIWAVFIGMLLFNRFIGRR